MIGSRMEIDIMALKGLLRCTLNFKAKQRWIIIFKISLLPAGPEIKITPAKGAYALSYKNWHKIYIKLNDIQKSKFNFVIVYNF